MLALNNKKDCVGCFACVSKCPSHCTTMIPDNEGFLYPTIEKKHCIDCGLCEKVCPVINKLSLPSIKPQTYAAKHKDETIRRMSSSGGIFTALAEIILQRKGVVFGAKFNDQWEVVHDYVESVDALSVFRGSKYVQSLIGNSYNKAEGFLKQNRDVLFSGTPCQIAGLRRFLGKNYDNLIAIDFVCHGVPSPKVFRLYLKAFLKGRQYTDANANTVLAPPFHSLRGISFRDKTTGWKRYSFITQHSPGKDQELITFRETLNINIFMRGFLHDIYLRPSCYACPAKSFTSGSDITIGDYWGIEKYYAHFDDDRGTSLVLVSSINGERLYQLIGDRIIGIKTSYEQALRGNPSLECSVKPHPMREYFFINLTEDNLCHRVVSLTKPTLVQIIKRNISRMLHLTGIIRLVKKTCI